MRLMECHCVFSVPLSPRLLLFGRAVIERAHPLFLIWKATCALKGTQLCECACLCLLTHEHLNNRAASKQKVFTGFAVRKQQLSPFPNTTCNLPLCPGQLICLCVSAVSVLQPRISSPRRSHIPTSLYLEVRRSSCVLFFKPRLCSLTHACGKTTVTCLLTYLCTLHCL